MRASGFILPAFIALSLLSATRAGEPEPRRGRGRSGDRRVVLLELYTSQG